MSASISPIRFPNLADLAAGAGRPGDVGPGFGSVLKDAVQKVESFQQQAGREVNQLLNGEGDDLHGAILATQRADLAFELFIQMRNKIVQTYQEVMRMQI